MIRALEIIEGLVARFDPQQLVACGAAPNRRPESAVAGLHYFVCLGRCGQYSVWIPAYSRHQPGRVKLRWKGGSADWVERDSYVDMSQMWVVPDSAIEPASHEDRTARGLRNHASLFFLVAAEDVHGIVA
jgi:hypothetical protein